MTATEDLLAFSASATLTEADGSLRDVIASVTQLPGGGLSILVEDEQEAPRELLRLPAGSIVGIGEATAA